MKEIEQIYHNDFGVAFHWKKNNVLLKERIQLVFKETGFYLSLNEMREFANITGKACLNMGCGECGFRNKCHRFLLKTPFKEIDLAVSGNELLQIKDLIEGALFNMELSQYLDGVCRN